MTLGMNVVKKIYVLTGNPGKFDEIRKFLESSNIIVHQIEVDLEEIQELDAMNIIEHKAK
jgi:inosine/xanthosine triphosphate pyrophosphatase family protein